MRARLPASGLLLVAVLLLAWAPAARAFSYYNIGGANVVWAGAFSQRYLSPSTFPPGGVTTELYGGALGLWMIVPSADFTYAGTINDQDYTIDHYDGYSDTAAVDPSELDPGVLAVTYMVNNGAQWYDMDMVFGADAAGYNWNFTPDPDCDIVGNGQQNGIAFILVATHELGHALGLGHDPQGTEAPGTTWFIGTMNPAYPAGGPISSSNIVELHGDDRQGLRFLYPHSGQATPVLDAANPGYMPGSRVGKAVPATFMPESIAPGGMLTLNSAVENFGNTNIANMQQGFFLSADTGIDPQADLVLGHLNWDIAAGDCIQFQAEADLPTDLAAGTYYVGSILDETNAFPGELYKDNNTHVYCSPLTVVRLAPVINELGQHTAQCGQPWTSPAPTVTHPVNMAPLTWSLESPPAGMAIDPVTGVISWPVPVRSQSQYVLTVRATNSSGSATKYLFLGVDQPRPALVAIPDASVPGHGSYTGPAPQLTSPACMELVLVWSLEAGPAGMTVNAATGVVTWSPVRCSATPHAITVRATNAVGSGSVTWHLTATPCGGDANCDGSINWRDIDYFIAAMNDNQSAWRALFPGGSPPCVFANNDVNGDGHVNWRDIDPLIGYMNTFAP